MTRKKAPRGRMQFWPVAASAAGLMAAGGAMAETQISTATTAPVATSTANAGAADNINIVSGGSIKPTTAGPVVTIDSNNTLTNSGTIQTTAVDGSTGVLILGGHTGGLTNNGTISIDETITTTDKDGDGDADGPFVTGSNRYGVRVTGPLAFTGNITNASGASINVDGNDSIALSIETRLNGSILSQGAFSTIGDRTFAIKTTDVVTGDVSLLGAISVQGASATGVYVGGDVGGALVIQNALTSTGYRSTTRSTTQSVLDALDADDLLQGGSALVVTGNVGKGLLVDIPPTLSSTNPDVDGDGITDTSEGTGAISTFGRAPAVLIGNASRNITLGNVGTGNDAFGMVVRGTITGAGVYDGVDATAVQIGLTGGGSVDLSSGLRIQGSIGASAYKADATAIHLGSGAIVRQIWNQGGISASQTGETGAATHAILIDAGATAPYIGNAGTITATVLGSSGQAIAVQDLSGSLTSIVNLRTISAVISPVDTTLTNTGTAIALDLRANTTGVTLRQYGLVNVVAGDGQTDTDGDGVSDNTEPVIIGKILLGSGADKLSIENGTVTGDIAFGAGANSLSISGGAVVTGKITADGGTLDLAIASDKLTVQNPATINLSSLNLGAASTLIVSADPEAGTHTQLEVAGAANVATGAKIGIDLQSLLKGSATYTLVHATSLTSGALDTSLLGSVPYLYNASLSTDASAGTISVALSRKTAAALGLPAATASAYEPIIAAIDKDTDVRNAFLTQTTSAGFVRAYNQMLPNYSGSVFQAVAATSDTAGRAIDDRQGPDAGGAWLQETSVVVQRDGTASLLGYKATGFALVGGNEVAAGNWGVLGLTAGLSSMDIKDDGANANQTLSVDQIEAGTYWRYVNGNLVLNARLAAAYVQGQSRRAVFIYDDNDALVAKKTAEGDWSGWMVNGRVAAAYEGRLGGYYARPVAALDYLRLEEGAYSERNGGDAVDLHVSARQSSRSTGFAGFVTGTRYGDQDGWWGPEFTLGYREIGQEEAGSTTAKFLSGTDSFTLLADQIKGGGVVARFAVKGEASGGAFAVEGGAETRDNVNIYDLRLAAHFKF